MTKFIMHGCNGAMGQVITRLAKEDPEVTIVAGIDINDNKEISNIDKINDILKQFDNICIFNNIDKLNENIRKELKEKVINKLIALIPIK